MKKGKKRVRVIENAMLRVEIIKKKPTTTMIIIIIIIERRGSRRPGLIISVLFVVPHDRVGDSRSGDGPAGGWYPLRPLVPRCRAGVGRRAEQNGSGGSSGKQEEEEEAAVPRRRRGRARYGGS